VNAQCNRLGDRCDVYYTVYNKVRSTTYEYERRSLCKQCIRTLYTIAVDGWVDIFPTISRHAGQSASIPAPAPLRCTKLTAYPSTGSVPSHHKCTVPLGFVPELICKKTTTAYDTTHVDFNVKRINIDLEWRSICTVGVRSQPLSCTSSNDEGSIRRKWIQLHFLF